MFDIHFQVNLLTCVEIILSFFSLSPRRTLNQYVYFIAFFTLVSILLTATAKIRWCRSMMNSNIFLFLF